MKALKPVTNLKLLKKRIEKLPAQPAKPLKGAGYTREGFALFPELFLQLQKLAPNHCAIVVNREAINSFGKLGFVNQDHVSPELWAIVEANLKDFIKLENALALVKEFDL